MKNLSLKWKVLIPLLLVLATTVIQINLIISMNRAQQEDAVKVNIAGRQRMLSQRMAKDVFGFVLNKNAKHQEDLKLASDTFEQSLKVLKSGGELDVGGSKVYVSKTDLPEINDLLTKAESDWRDIKSNINSISSESNSAVTESISGKLGDMVTTFDKATKMYETASAASVSRDMTVIYGCAIGYLFLILFSWQVTNKYIIRPVSTLQKEAEKIAAGDLTN